MFIRLIIYLTPLLIGLLTPFLMNWKGVREHIKTRTFLKSLLAFKSVLIVVFSLIFILSLVFLFGGGGFVKFFNLLLFLIGFSVLIISLFILLVTLGISGNLSQFMLTMLVVLMYGTVFCANPLIETYKNDQETRQTIIGLAVNLNPMLVIAGNFFDHDLMRAQHMYRISLIGPYYPYSYTDWRYLLIGYLITAILCLALTRIILTRRSTSESLPQS